MQYKQLGNTGLIVSRLCLGTMTFGDGTGVYQHIGNVDQAGADALVKASVDAGINFFDTADIYSHGHSEETLGRSFRNLGLDRRDVVLATKGYMRTGPGRNAVGASRGHIIDAVDASLKRIGTDYIDLYQIHQSDALTPIEETLRALDDLVRQDSGGRRALRSQRLVRSASPLGNERAGVQCGRVPRRLAGLEPALAVQVALGSDQTLSHLCDRVQCEYDVRVGITAMWKTLGQPGLSFKKRSSAPASNSART